MNQNFQKISPLLLWPIIIVICVISFFIFWYVLLFILVTGLALYAYAWIRMKFFRAKNPNANMNIFEMHYRTTHTTSSEKSGRVIEHDK